MGKCNKKMLELGNLMFNSNKNQQYYAPMWVEALIENLSDYIDYMPNIEWNPFQNSGGEIKIKELHIQAYNWDENKSDEYNLKYKDLELSWYKHCRRDLTINWNPQENGFADKFANYWENIKNLIDEYDGSGDES